jgi:hypothetical protein
MVRGRVQASARLQGTGAGGVLKFDAPELELLVRGCEEKTNDSGAGRRGARLEPISCALEYTVLRMLVPREMHRYRGWRVDSTVSIVAHSGSGSSLGHMPLGVCSCWNSTYG